VTVGGGKMYRACTERCGSSGVGSPADHSGSSDLRLPTLGHSPESPGKSGERPNEAVDDYLGNKLRGSHGIEVPFDFLYSDLKFPRTHVPRHNRKGSEMHSVRDLHLGLSLSFHPLSPLPPPVKR